MLKYRKIYYIMLCCIMMLNQLIKICFLLYFWYLSCTMFVVLVYIYFLKYRYICVFLVSSCFLDCTVVQFLQCCCRASMFDRGWVCFIPTLVLFS
jgi:hypothetical protein